MTVVVPNSSAEEAPVPGVMASVTFEAASVTRFPRLSVIPTVVVNADVCPAVPPGGCMSNESEEALAGIMLNSDVTALVSPLLEKVSV